MDSRKRKSWADYDIGSVEYKDGLTKFVKLAFESACDMTIACPCSKCVRYHRRSEEEVYDHLVINGPMRDFEKWYTNNELGSTSTLLGDDQVLQEKNVADDLTHMLGDAFGFHDEIVSDASNLDSQVDQDIDNQQTNEEHMNSNADMFNKLLQDATMQLYPGCSEYSRLSFILHLYHIKTSFVWSDNSFSEILKLLKRVLPEGEKLPESLYETRKIIDEISLSCEKIDACPNDCMLFWKDKATDDTCSVCGESRWKPFAESSSKASSRSKTKKEKKIPIKVLRYFPLTPRLQRLYMSSKTAEEMIWHDKDRKKEEGVLRHPADTEAWKKFDSIYTGYSSEPRNVRLGLATDGFNPFGEKRSTYSTWPVILMAYNLPPWFCMKKPFLMLSLLILGPKAPRNNIDIYLQPLIDELKMLWEVGVPTYDAYNKETFQMHASLLWTINDFPAYGNLSGWCVYGKNACPCCNEHTWSKRYKNSGKCCYLGTRMHLDLDHKYRNDEKSFDNTKEHRQAPSPPSGYDVLEQLKNVSFTLGKTHAGQIDGVKEKTWKKLSIFFELPYWKDVQLRHNLDVMHMEKNVCDNIINTLLNVPKKSKDNLKARRTLKEIGVRKHLWPVERSKGKHYLPPAPYNLSNAAKDRFCEVLENVKFPDGYASNISRCVMKQKLSGLKSHDCHVLMQLLLPLAMRESVTEKVASVLIELCDFFRALCSKTLIVQELIDLKSKVVITHCNMEKIFPPTFFTIMVHLVVHLADEAIIAGPVHYRWMYPIERFRTKDYERNKKTQNSGVMVIEKTQSYASTRDTRPIVGEVTYYGVLDDIIELNYYNKFKIVLFKCYWADINHASGIKIDKLKFTLVKLSRSMYSGDRLTDEPFVFASQVRQVIYVQDRTTQDWYIPIPVKPRDTFDMGDEDSEPNHLMEFNETQTSNCVHNQQNVEIDIDDLTWMSSDVRHECCRKT